MAPRTGVSPQWFQSGMMVSLSQSGPVVHLEAWGGVGCALRAFGRAETRVAPDGLKVSRWQIEVVDSLLAQLGQPPIPAAGGDRARACAPPRR